MNKYKEIQVTMKKNGIEVPVTINSMEVTCLSKLRKGKKICEIAPEVYRGTQTIYNTFNALKKQVGASSLIELNDRFSHVDFDKLLV
jgi:DNA-binding NarL/FixJ family response regulator